MDEKKLNELRKKLTKLAKRYGIAYAILFGSQAEGRAIKGESDVDIAIKIKKRRLSRREKAKLILDLARELNGSIDIVILNDAPFSVAFDALLRGKVLIVNDESELFRYRELVFKLHDDFNRISRIFEKREMEKLRG